MRKKHIQHNKKITGGSWGGEQDKPAMKTVTAGKLGYRGPEHKEQKQFVNNSLKMDLSKQTHLVGELMYKRRCRVKPSAGTL